MRSLSAKMSGTREVPFGNYGVMLLATIIFAIQMTLDPQSRYLNGLVLQGWSACALLGHMWLHMSVSHIGGNLITLWIFGNKVSTRVGNSAYPLIYVAAGLGAAVAHILYDGRPVIGASGAIMGVLGVYVVLCFAHFGRLGPWLVLTWFLATLCAGTIGGSSAAYMAHIGGFLSGMMLAVLLLIVGAVSCDSVDPGLLRIVKLSHRERGSGQYI